MQTKRGHPSVQDFAENVQEYLARLRKSDMPMVLSVDGEPAVVVFDIRLFEFFNRTGQWELGEILEARIRKIDSGEDEGIPAEQVFRELRAELAARGSKRGKKRS
ncbi:MAG TPA: hypothetical protein VGR35_22815 [Tepidisphaeraceae bacterium]|nr:hypothetical protein [Tepidisphaeraceae bacterium]